MPFTTRRAIICAAAVLVSPLALHAQIDAALEGRIADPSGAAIPNAQVTLTQSVTGVQQRAVTSAAGLYNFRSLVPGVYSLKIEAPGFQQLIRNGVTVTVGQTTALDLTPPIGGVSDTVTVNADAPLLQLAQADIETNIDGHTVRQIPLNSRNFINLTQLIPGVELPPGTLLPRINGGRPRTNEYLFDGISALQPEPGQVAFFPIVDDIAEFTVEANNVPAEFGRFNGGVVNVATRAGGNQFHGSVYEFFRNEDLNALNYFAVVGARKPEYRRNLYGGTLGGPVLHDKLFYFADYQGIKSLIGRPITSTIPTLNERKGIFTGVSKIYNPNTTVTTGGKQIRTEFPADTINIPLDPAAVALLNRFPTPTTSAAANNYTRTANDADHQNQLDFRLDYALGTHDRAFGRYSYFSDVEQPITALPDGSGATAGAVLGTGAVAGLSHVLGQQAVFNEVHTFTPRLVNDYRLGYTRRSNNIGGPTLGNTASSALNIPGIPTNAAFANALPLFTFTGFQFLGPAAGTFSQYQTGVWETTDTVSYTIGRHAFKAGLDYRFYQLNAVAPPNPTGSFAFTTTGTDTQTAAATTTSGGNAIASFLLGQVDTFSIDLQTSILRPRDHIQEYFLQDDWRATDKLTFNIGARYTIAFASTEKNNQGAVFNLQTQLLDYVGQAGNPNVVRPTRYDNVAPRIGVNYAITPHTVVRSGFGIVFIDQSGITTPFTVPQFPYIQNIQQKTQDSINAAFKLSNGPTVNPIPINQNAGLGQSVYTVNRQANAGYVEQWNLAFQQTITRNLSVDVAYVGSHIVHVGIPDSNLNQITAAQLMAGAANGVSLTTKVTNPYYGQLPTGSTLNTPTIAEAQLIKPYPRFQNVATYRNNSGTSNYNAIEAKVEQRMSKGVYLLFAYTHSKLIDDASSVFSSTVLSSPNTSSLVAADTFRPYLERDSSSGDMPNVVSGAVTYELPAGRNHRFASHGALLYALGGWSLNSIVIAQSGMPVTVTQATNNNAFAGFALQRPNLVHNPALHGDARAPQHFFDVSAFQAVGTYALGNASRNPVRGPAYRDLDLSAIKTTRFTEHTDLEFRAELFNLTNTPQFAQPNGSFGSAAFGTITATSAEQRVAQFAAKLHF